MCDRALAELGCAFVEAEYVGIALSAQSRVALYIHPSAGADLDHTLTDVF